MTAIIALLWPPAIYALVLLLHRALPARHVRGYVRDPATGEPLGYRLNGLLVAVVTVALWALACRRGWLAWDAFYLHRFAMAGSACVLGLVFTVAVVARAPRRPGSSLLADLYLGRRDNPRALGVDAKMFLYLVGAVMLALNVLSFAAHHLLAHPDDPSPGVLLYAVMFTFFVAEYLTFEEVHLYTYDLSARS